MLVRALGHCAGGGHPSMPRAASHNRPLAAADRGRQAPCVSPTCGNMRLCAQARQVANLVGSRNPAAMLPTVPCLSSACAAYRATYPDKVDPLIDLRAQFKCAAAVLALLLCCSCSCSAALALLLCCRCSCCAVLALLLLLPRRGRRCGWPAWPVACSDGMW